MSNTDSTAALTTPQQTLSLKEWQKRLSLSAIPVDPAVKTAAIQKLLCASGNAHNVANILVEDPVLVLRLVSTANKSLMRTGNEVKSLPHAISLLGVPQTESLLRSCQEYQQEQSDYHLALRQQLAISLHAAQQILGFSSLMPRWALDEIYLATLLHRAPLWALWSQAPALMTTLQAQRLANRGAHHNLREKALLGCSVQTLAANLCRQWQLPTLSQHSWFASEQGNPRQWIMLSRIIPEQSRIALDTFANLQRLVSSPAFAICLFNRLADAADWDWSSHRSLRLQHIIATCVGQPLVTVVNITHQQAASMPALPGTQHPAHQLLGHYHRNPSVVEPVPTAAAQVQAEQVPALQARALTNPQQESVSLPELINQLREHPQNFTHLAGLFELCLSLLARDNGLDRCCALLIHGPSRELRTAFSHGCDDYPALLAFRHRFQRGDLFNKLLQKPLSLHVQVDNYSKISTLLPVTFKRANATNQFYMMSIFAADKPIGILYADSAISNQPLTGPQYTLFKQLCTAIGECITQRAQT